LQQLWSGPNADVLAAVDELYQDDVNYYGKKTTKAGVLKEKRAFAQRFPQREYKPKDPVLVSCRDETCTVHGEVDFRAIDPIAHVLSTGVATFDYEFVVVGAKLKIQMENGHVVTRTRQTLSPNAAR